MSNKELKEIFEKGLFRGEIKFDEPMSAHTSLKIGGPVDVMVFPEDPVSLKNVLLAAHSEGIPVFVLGAGTNLLVSDGGMEGIAVSLKNFKKIEFIQNLKEIHPDVFSDGLDNVVGLYVEAGISLSSLLNFLKNNGYSGLEALAGIPGSFGGAIYMNTGSFGTEIKDVVLSIAIIKLDGRIMLLKEGEFRFFYRGIEIPDSAIILSANIVLKKDNPENVSARFNEFLKKKRNSQPIGRLSAGCVFKNPEGDFAGRLTEMAGCKGMRIGDVEVNMLHANYFINRGHGTCKDFIELMEIVKKKVKEFSGIMLEPEIKIIGRG